MNQVVFPYDSNIRYLPLVYFLPEDVFFSFASCRAACLRCLYRPIK